MKAKIILAKENYSLTPLLQQQHQVCLQSICWGSQKSSALKWRNKCQSSPCNKKKKKQQKIIAMNLDRNVIWVLQGSISLPLSLCRVTWISTTQSTGVLLQVLSPGVNKLRGSLVLWGVELDSAHSNFLWSYVVCTQWYFQELFVLLRSASPGS